MERQTTGARGEALAQVHLKKHGYRVIETNYRTRYGEIDIIARKKDTLVFVEVRTKTSLTYGIPEESVTPAKARHLISAAYHYQRHHKNLPESWRIDFVAIVLDDDGKIIRLNHIESAVEG